MVAISGYFNNTNMKLREIIAYVIVGALLLILFQKCTENRDLQALNSGKSQEVEYYKNELGTVTATVQALTISKEQLENDLEFKNDSIALLLKEFKNPKVITITKTITEIDSVQVPYDVLIPCEFKPVFGTYSKDKNITFDYVIRRSNFVLDNIEIPNTQTTITGIKKKWFLGREYQTTDITNSNPYIKTVEVKSYQVRYQKPFYDTRAFNLIVGAALGYYINSQR